MTQKTLIIRFSSFGDIVQSLACVPELATKGEVHFLTKSNFSQLPQLCPAVAQVHAFNSKAGLMGLIRLAWRLRQENYDLVYDAHQNPRSKIVRFIVAAFKKTAVRVRSKQRWRRFLFFKLKKRDAIPMPFRGMVSYCDPVGVKPTQQQWRFEELLSSARMRELDRYAQSIVLVPSAAWEMKRWPKEHWHQLVQLLPQLPYVILGGPEDHFCQEIAASGSNVVNLAGNLTLIESCYVVARARAVVSADTGLLHVADLLKVPVIALLGPSAFGFPTFSNAHELGVNLRCRPCSKDGSGTCVQAVWRLCMVEIKPMLVANKLRQLLVS